MAPVRPVSHQSRDGLTIHGYLTLPAGRAPREPGLHRQPARRALARDGWGFNPEVQFLANRGFWYCR